ncbi:snRNA-activating protein complex subunit 3 [Caerostris extrusa]|uniref:snRNA-activating protein complex subunit 3 n=1 Tax=Caerostris extrusa TaxID=172846 RepID=A0AAV4TF79_CAEEX|nr:snRNA-activating protein complex subunit 3 [Caerostris extrusa]
MENVHKSTTRPWIAPKVNLKEFRDKWHETLSTFQDDTKETFQMTDEEYAKLEEECGLSAMYCPNQEYMEISKEFNLFEDVGLETLRLQRVDMEKRKKDEQYDALVSYQSKFYTYPHHEIINREQSEESPGFEEVQEPEILLTVQIFRPEKRQMAYNRNSQTKLPNFTVDQEFMVLGCQYLSELRDKIECISDIAIPGEFSECPEIEPDTTCKDLYKSNFLFIDDVFYNDMRYPDCKDYSKIIIDWANEKNRGIGPFKKTLMEKTKFIDLSIQLGYPYVYVHQGNCEHMIVFSDLQFYTRHYCNNKLLYPMHCSLKNKRRVLCMICNLYTAMWVVFDNKRLPENPFYFCKKCYFSFNYVNNKKIGEFSAYHHIDRSKIL